MQMNSNRVNIHGYCSNFGYLDNSGLTSVEDFWDKMCKICYFLYVAKFYKGWCDCSKRKVFSKPISRLQGMKLHYSMS